MKKAFLTLILSAAVLGTAGCASVGNDWSKTTRTDSIGAYSQFLRKHPGSEYAASAESRLGELQAEEAARVAEQEKKAEAERTARKKALIPTSKLWLKNRDAAAMSKLLSYCFKESATENQVKELMGNPDQISNQQGVVWVYEAKPGKNGKVLSAIFGFSGNKKVVRGVLKSSTGAMHQVIRHPSGEVEQGWSKP